MADGPTPRFAAVCGAREVRGRIRQRRGKGPDPPGAARHGRCGGSRRPHSTGRIGGSREEMAGPRDGTAALSRPNVHSRFRPEVVVRRT